jgi:hypothetical protein
MFYLLFIAEAHRVWGVRNGDREMLELLENQRREEWPGKDFRKKCSEDGPRRSE